MAFQIKDFTSIAASMINWMRATQQKITDFNVGSVARTMVEAPAVELDQLYQQMFIGLKEAIPVSVYNTFGFGLIEEVSASGLIRVTITPATVPTLIPASTTFASSSGGPTYVSGTDVTIAAGSSFADVLVTCTVAGTVGNITPGTAFTLAPAVSNIISAVNLSAFASGVDQETDDERKVRFNAFVSALNRGTVDALKYGLTLATQTDASGNIIERVATSSIIEPWLADSSAVVSLVHAYVHNGVGNTSPALVDRARQVVYGYTDTSGARVPGWKAAGTKLTVEAATEQLVNVSGALDVLPGFDEPTMRSQAVQIIYSLIQNLAIGQTLIMSEVVRQVKDLDGVYDIKFSVPSDNVSVNNATKLMPGTISIT